MTGAATNADACDQREDDVFCRDAWAKGSINAHQIGLRLALQKALGGKDHLDFTGADAEGECAEGAVGCRV